MSYGTRPYTGSNIMSTVAGTPTVIGVFYPTLTRWKGHSVNYVSLQTSSQRMVGRSVIVDPESFIRRKEPIEKVRTSSRPREYKGEEGEDGFRPE